MERPALGVIIPGTENPLYGERALRVRRLAEARGYGVHIENAADCARGEAGCVESLLGRGIKGLIAMPASAAAHALYEKLPVPAVLLGSRTESADLDYVVLDDYHAAFLAVSRLVDCGRRRIAFLACPQAQGYAAIDRLNGCQKAVRRQPDGERSQFMLRPLSSERLDESCAAARALLALPEPPTAIVAQNDYIAYGAMQAVAEAGLTAGKDVAVIGFDDLLFSRLPKLRLTSVAESGCPLPDRAFSLLLRRLTEPVRAGRCGVVLAPRLVFRATFREEPPC